MTHTPQPKTHAVIRTMSSRFTFSHCAGGFIGVMILGLLAACSGNRNTADGSCPTDDRYPKLVDPFTSDSPGENADSGRPTARTETSQQVQDGSLTAEVGNWSILLATFSRTDHEEQARRIRQEFIEISGMKDAWIESTDTRSVLRYGRYDSYESRAAQRDLGRIKNLAIGNHKPFRAASLSPIGTGAVMGHYPQFNLINVREQFPDYDEIYTLQIGRYAAEEDTTREQARQLAEQAVIQLRTAGEMAYYYHGPRMSLVCVGLFFGPVIDSELQAYTQDVQMLRARFPNNSFNGRQINRKMTLYDGSVKDLGPEPSFPVEVPHNQG